MTPTDNDDRVVHFHPGDAAIISSLVIDFLTALLLSKLNCFICLAVEIDQALLSEDAFTVNAENSGCLEVAVDGSIAQNLLHQSFLGRGAPATADLIRLSDLADWCAGLVVAALVALGLLLVRCALLGDEMGVFGQDDVEVRPAAVATLVHVVAGQQLLRRKHGWLLAVLEL